MRAMALFLLVLVGRVAHAGLLQPGNVPFTVECGTTINVDDTNNGFTLVLEPTDPIVTTTCAGRGIRIRNRNKGFDRSFDLDCDFNQMTGDGTGKGIELRGPNLSIANCLVDAYRTGIFVRGDGGFIEECRVTNSASDGIVVKNPIGPRNENFFGIVFESNRSIANAGWGMNLRGNGLEIGVGTFNNIAQSNARGGISLRGGLAFLSGNEASNNGGPGFLIRSTQCCRPNEFDTALAFSNAGPGIVYIGRDDQTNCVGGTGAECTGGTFYPAGWDPTPGGIDAFNNAGICPPGTLPDATGSDQCPVVVGEPCRDAQLDRCFF